MWLLHIIFFAIILLINQLPSLTIAEPIRGNNIHPANIPFIASLAFKVSNCILDRGHFCTGSLISPILVLTAAHCVRGQKYNNVDVVIGAADLRGARPKYNVLTWITFDEWGSNGLAENDIAIIRLKTPVNNAVLANLAPLGAAQPTRRVNLIGWVKGPEDIAGRFLRRAYVHILTETDCVQRYQLINNQPIIYSQGLFCVAAYPFALATGADSGGPVLDENNNILGVIRSFCKPDDTTLDCNFDKQTFTFVTDLIDDYRRFIDDIKSIP